MKHEYHIDTEKGIMTHSFHGDVYIKDWEQERLKSLSDADYHPTFNVLVDMQGATMKSEPEEIEKFVPLLKATPESYGIKHALLVDSPNETAMAMIYQDCVKTLRNVKVFSTYEAAVEWLGV